MFRIQNSRYRILRVGDVNDLLREIEGWRGVLDGLSLGFGGGG